MKALIGPECLEAVDLTYALRETTGYHHIEDKVGGSPCQAIQTMCWRIPRIQMPPFHLAEHNLPFGAHARSGLDWCTTTLSRSNEPSAGRRDAKSGSPGAERKQNHHVEWDTVRQQPKFIGIDYQQVSRWQKLDKLNLFPLIFYSNKETFWLTEAMIDDFRSLKVLDMSQSTFQCNEAVKAFFRMIAQKKGTIGRNVNF